ncbi:MAG: hypothetical protein U9M90_03110 [Patescibacteria group bacterium]|nr:hypothetical protein [Patescibacteria group bacterium]
MKKRKAVLLIVAVFLFGAYWALSCVVSQLGQGKKVYFSSPESIFWKVKSIDTMKYSRDLAGEKLNDSDFVQEVEWQIFAIAKTGATHVAIGTPYDEQFHPFLRLWVDTARKHNLKVWFRGNWSAWEGWFGFSQNMTRQQHIEKTEKFIIDHPDFFSDGDIFSSCPECENGKPGDPRHNDDLLGHRKFIAEEYLVAKKAFKTIGKDVKANYFSMNGDVARLVMNKETTKKLDGIVVIDHYVASPEQLVSDIKEISNESGGKVVLGEWGVPIPDIHGKMTEDQKADWMSKALDGMVDLGDILVGMNYWAAFGGSAALWAEGEKNSKTSEVLQKYFSPQLVYGRVIDEFGNPISRARVSVADKEIFSANDGYFEFYSLEKVNTFSVAAEGYFSKSVDISEEEGQQRDIFLMKEKRDFISKLLLWLKK